MDVVVDENELVVVIGCSGQNVCFVGELIGWQINIMMLDEFVLKQGEECDWLCVLFMVCFDVDEEVVDILIDEGFMSFEEIVYVLFNEMFEIEVFDEDIVYELCNCVCDVLLMMVIVNEEKVENVVLDFKSFDGIMLELFVKLVEYVVQMCDDFVELVVDELVDMIGMEEDVVKVLIMKVCEYWFQ